MVYKDHIIKFDFKKKYVKKWERKKYREPENLIILGYYLIEPENRIKLLI
jgi:hypothetical protein